MIIEKNVRNMDTRCCDLNLYSCESLTSGFLRTKKNTDSAFQVNWKGRHFRDIIEISLMVSSISVGVPEKEQHACVFRGQNLFMDKTKEPHIRSHLGKPALYRCWVIGPRAS